MNLQSYIQELDDNGRICLQGAYWDDAFTIIIGTTKRDTSEPPAPLILAGWHMSSDEQKKERFRGHLATSYENGTWDKLLAFLKTVPDDVWYGRK